MNFSKAHLKKLESILQKDYGGSFNDAELRKIAEQLSRMTYLAQKNLNKNLQKHVNT
ncbi:MAG: hypothetical protein ACJKTH_03375 [Patescibacteria group bacterium UBA2163]